MRQYLLDTMYLEPIYKGDQAHCPFPGDGYITTKLLQVSSYMEKSQNISRASRNILDI